MNAQKPIFVVTLDEYGVVDTITKNGKALSASHREVQRILKAFEGSNLPADVRIAESKKT